MLTKLITIVANLLRVGPSIIEHAAEELAPVEQEVKTKKPRKPRTSKPKA